MVWRSHFFDMDFETNGKVPLFTVKAAAEYLLSCESFFSLCLGRSRS